MNELLIAINTAMEQGSLLALPASFVWGMVSVLLSPCHMASIPLLVAYVAGQRRILLPREAAGYALLFAGGLFLSIITIGMVCAMVGRMLGDVGSGWQIAVGIILVWAAWPLFRAPRCAATGGLLQRFHIRGMGGAFVLGLAYGFLSGACTFGFIAPLLGVITLRQETMSGIVMLCLFAAGHCLPLVAAGMFSARIMAIMHSNAWQRQLGVLRKGAGLVIAGTGGYLIITSLLP